MPAERIRNLARGASTPTGADGDVLHRQNGVWVGTPAAESLADIRAQVNAVTAATISAAGLSLASCPVVLNGTAYHIKLTELKTLMSS